LHTDGEESHAIVMKAQIQSGDVSNPKNIEESTESARTEEHNTSVRTLSRKLGIVQSKQIREYFLIIWRLPSNYAG
jgi:hypothetical protein